MISKDLFCTCLQGLPVDLTAPARNYIGEIKNTILYWAMTVPAVMNQVIRMEIIKAPR